MTSGVMTTVNIFDREYSVISDLRSEYLLQLAAYIDLKMRDIAHEDSMVSATRLAILALLHIADELFHEKNNKQELIAYVDTKITQILEIIDTKKDGVIS